MRSNRGSASFLLARHSQGHFAIISSLAELSLAPLTTSLTASEAQFEPSLDWLLSLQNNAFSHHPFHSADLFV